MKRQWKGFVSGILVAVLLFGLAGTATATVGKRTVEVDYNNIKVTLDGEMIALVDANGDAVEPFIINGTTYLPVRAVATAFGLDVDWDGTTNTVVLERHNSKSSSQPEVNAGENDIDEKHLMTPGDVFTPGGYILFENVEIMYDGENFLIRNDGKDIIRITETIVGIKADGTYETLQSGGPYGVDEAQYEEDLAENGWAIEHMTNMVRPGETLTASAKVITFGQELDVDKDGYYDITFTVSPQKDEDTVSFSTNDSVTKAYKLKAE